MCDRTIDSHLSYKSMTTVISQALKEFVPDDANNPFAAWAGECGQFLDVVCKIADEQGVKYSIGNAYDGKIEGEFDLTPPLGLTHDDLVEYQILSNLNHIWIISDNLHFDAATPEGVKSIFDLRIVRQVAVEMIRRKGQENLDILTSTHKYWDDSVKLFDDYLDVIVKAEHQENNQIKIRSSCNRFR